MDDFKSEFWVLTGPNGAGKSTYAPTLCGEFRARHNCDLVYFNPDEEVRKKSRDMLDVLNVFFGETVHQLFARRASFLIETTIPGKPIYDLILRARSARYRIGVVAIGVATADLAKDSVGLRKRGGGHDVPDEVTVTTHLYCQKITPKLITFSDTARVLDRDAAGNLTEILSFDNGVLTLHACEDAIRRTNPYMSGFLDRLRESASTMPLRRQPAARSKPISGHRM